MKWWHVAAEVLSPTDAAITIYGAFAAPDEADAERQYTEELLALGFRVRSSTARAEREPA